MRKDEAAAFLKELLTVCKLDSNSFVLVDPNPNDSLSTGYQIRIKATIDNECRQHLRELTLKYNWAVIEEQSQIRVYKPTKRAGNLFLE